MTPEQHALESWRSAATGAPLPPLDELRTRADKFRRKIQRRNWIEYAAGAFVIACFGLGIFLAPLLAMRMGCALVVGGTCVVLWQLHRRGSPLNPPEHGGQLTLLEYRRRDLMRQRDALDSIFVWYLLPLIPGLAVLMAAPLFSLPFSEWQMPSASALPGLVFPPLVFVAIYALNKWAARQLQKDIDEIESLQAE